VAKYNGVVNDLGTAICELVGIEASNVSSIDIHLSVNSPATIEIMYFIDKPDSIAQEIRKYEIIPVEATRVSENGN